jgi:hypothetical protein
VGLYNLNAILKQRVLAVHIAASLNLALWRLSIGVGYNYNRIAGDVYKGPGLKVSVWL